MAGLLVEQAGHESLVFPAAGPADATRAIHALNPTARLIWDLCDGGHTLADIELALRAAYEVPANADVQLEIARTLEVFLRKGLLQA